MRILAEIPGKVALSIFMFGRTARTLYRRLVNPPRPFVSSEKYWIERYDSGENSGCGSYNELAKYKAEFLNNFVRQKALTTIMEFGCGDGNQLKLAVYPTYIGFDISPRALTLCEEAFSGDNTKTFRLLREYKNETAQLTLSLDVIYHLIEDDIFEEHMRRLFASAESYVIIYSSDSDHNENDQVVHVRHRKFTTWVQRNEPFWILLCHIPNPYPYKGDIKRGSSSDFYVYGRAHQ